MPESTVKPKRLATGKRIFTLFAENRQTLWLAGDHLLLQASSGYNERVRRFYFADIQSIVYARTNAGVAINVVCGVLAALLLIAGLVVANSLGAAGAAVVGVLALAPLAAMALNFAAGPTCTCVFSTAVQSERIVALNRLPKVERVMGQILPLIDAAQGRLNAETLAVMPVQAEPLGPARHALDGGGTATSALRHEPGNMHRACFALCLALGASHAADLFLDNSVKDIVDMLLFAAIVITALIALRRQAGSDLPIGVKSVIPVALGLLGCTFVSSFVISMYFFLQDPTHMIKENGQFLLPRDSLLTQVYLVAETILFALAGVVGMMRLARAGTARVPAADTPAAADSGGDASL